MRAHEEEHDGRPERERLLHHHHDSGEPLVEERREPEEPLVLSGVRQIQRIEREDEHVGEDLPAGEEGKGEPDPSRSAQLAAAGGVGIAAIQLCKLAGAEVIGTASAPLDGGAMP